MREKEKMVRPERFELPAFWFVARRSIQLSYGRMVARKILSCRIGFGQTSSSHGKSRDSFGQSLSTHSPGLVHAKPL